MSDDPAEWLRQIRDGIRTDPELPPARCRTCVGTAPTGDAPSNWGDAWAQA